MPGTRLENATKFSCSWQCSAAQRKQASKRKCKYHRDNSSPVQYLATHSFTVPFLFHSIPFHFSLLTYSLCRIFPLHSPRRLCCLLFFALDHHHLLHLQLPSPTSPQPQTASPTIRAMATEESTQQQAQAQQGMTMYNCSTLYPLFGASSHFSVASPYANPLQWQIVLFAVVHSLPGCESWQTSNPPRPTIPTNPQAPSAIPFRTSRVRRSRPPPKIITHTPSLAISVVLLQQMVTASAPLHLCKLAHR